jgi:hypothetical protein
LGAATLQPLHAGGLYWHDRSVPKFRILKIHRAKTCAGGHRRGGRALRRTAMGFGLGGRSVSALPGKRLPGAETGAVFLATPADSGRQRPRYPASPAAKPREVKDYSHTAGKPDLRTGNQPIMGPNLIINGRRRAFAARLGRRDCGPIDMAPPAQAPSRWRRADQSRQ